MHYYPIKKYWQDCPLYKKLNKLTFNDNNEKKISISFSISEAKTLINKINSTEHVKIKRANFTPNERINLNNE
ncbi:MAG: hypothetical protein ACI9VO_000842 [Colwellia sp.]|jgi:hypothetical protein